MKAMIIKLTTLLVCALLLGSCVTKQQKANEKLDRSRDYAKDAQERMDNTF
ncbi:hypothetical protein AGMMS50212_04460 [Spirochaetia bacterium]|nr:hypothetical protein AGMMS50212_04460 [Spirochaetia bacterium]